MSKKNNTIENVYKKIYETEYGIIQNNLKNIYEFQYMKYYLYLYYIYTYILLYLHNLKFKVISNYNNSLLNITINNDYIFIYILLGLIPILFYYIYKKYISNKIIQYCIIVSEITLLLFLIYYGFTNKYFIYKSIYFYENLFISTFQFMGLFIIFLYLNPLIFLICFIFFFILKLIFPMQSYLFFGHWGHLNNKYLLLFMLIICIYIFTSIILDIYFSDFNIDNSKEILIFTQEDNISSDDNTINNDNQITEPIIIQKSTSVNIKSNQINNVVNKIYFNSDKNIQEEEDLSKNIINILKNFNIEGEIFNRIISSTVTNYFFKPKSGTKTSRIESIEDEIAIELNRNVRISSNIKGIIFEISNEFSNTFTFKDVWNKINHDEISNKFILPIFLGFDTFNENIIIDLVHQPHLLICGTTGSGKSSTIHTIIHSLILKNSYKKIQFVLIDPKILELSIYDNIPYLWNPIVTSMEEGVEILKKLVEEMEIRYKTMSKANKRSIIEYNKTASNPYTYIVFIIEEFADFALQKNSHFSNLVQKLAQMGRAAGIHGIIATQRPSVNVISGTIKANFPSRIGLKVANKLESRIILDNPGAEKLSKPGEMLLINNSGFLRRGICPYITEKETLNLIEIIYVLY